MMLKGEDVMSVENGQWIMYGIDADDPRCIHTPDELAAYVRRTGFVPLFGNTVKGFSVEEMTEAKHWWSGDGQDPWAWREQLANGRTFCTANSFAGRQALFRRNGFRILPMHGGTVTISMPGMTTDWHRICRSGLWMSLNRRRLCLRLF